jgi:hypothetical protein
MYKKNPQKEECTVFRGFFIAVVGHEIFFFYVWFSLNQDLHKMQLHTGTEHFGNVIKRGIAKRGCS